MSTNDVHSDTPDMHSLIFLIQTFLQYFEYNWPLFFFLSEALDSLGLYIILLASSPILDHLFSISWGHPSSFKPETDSSHKPFSMAAF